MILHGSIASLEQPKEGGLRVVGIPHKHLDTEALARVLIHAVMDRMAQKNGPLMTETEHKELEGSLHQIATKDRLKQNRGRGPNAKDGRFQPGDLGSRIAP
jgi:hypothetical protein